MQLTKNDRKTLMLLLENGRITDTEIASKLKITKQAVGKIRRKLEKEGIIKGYKVNIDYERLGIKSFAIATAVLSREGMQKGFLEAEENLTRNPHVINIFRVPSGDITHIIIYGFEDLDELTNYFHRMPDDSVDIKKIHVCSHIGLVKNDPTELIKEILNRKDGKKYKAQFLEIERFRKRIEG
ncbi:Lrp/AsnC family transcriptional regulator [Candidatus Woesearchaeota archaeon]|nr:MAG: Lrp/AsnC family transcriptional regulator [Candidatus Woesearchaeota archaeon]